MGRHHDLRRMAGLWGSRTVHVHRRLELLLLLLHWRRLTQLQRLVRHQLSWTLLVHKVHLLRDHLRRNLLGLLRLLLRLMHR